MRISKEILIGFFGGFVAWLCCITPLVLVMFGLASVSFSLSLSDILWGKYWWLFKLAGLTFIIAGILIYLARKKACNAVGLQQNKHNIGIIIKVAIISWLVISIVVEILWLFYFPK